MPWCTDGPSEARARRHAGRDAQRLGRPCHAQGGTVVAAHLPNPNGEPAALIATGRVDAVEMLAQSDGALLEYYRYLNCGYRLPLVGGTDKMSSDVPVGLYRTYARLDGDESYDGWCRAVRAGRTFLSGGPLLTLTVDGREPGDTVELTGPGTVTVDAAVTSVFPLRSLELVCNGEVIAAARTDGGRHAVPLRAGPGRRALLDRLPRVRHRQPSRRVGSAGVRPHLPGVSRVRRRMGNGRPPGPALHANAGRGDP